MLSNTNSRMQLVPTIGTLVLAAQRLLPAVQQMYASWAQINNYKSDILNVLIQLESPNIEEISMTLKSKINFSTITFNSVSYQYPGSESAAIRNITMTLNRNDFMGIMGGSGSGKSTFLDLLMGLLKPSSGSILIDGKCLHSNKRLLNDWMASIAHVPQYIYLADTTIAENIAFPLTFDRLDIKRVISSAKYAQIDSYIENLQTSYNTIIGESGIRLSGGQRQRLGIAKAFYKRADLYIFDEATSALDQYTESRVISTFKTLASNSMVIHVSHNQKSLSLCNKLIRIDNGTLMEVF